LEKLYLQVEVVEAILEALVALVVEDLEAALLE
jgi:hypothetical protein